jgi:hypothetical protein
MASEVLVSLESGYFLLVTKKRSSWPAR